MLNTGSAISSICAPLAFGFIADITGNYSTPFSASLCLLLVGAAMCLVMRPDRQVQDSRLTGTPLVDTHALIMRAMFARDAFTKGDAAAAGATLARSLVR